MKNIEVFYPLSPMQQGMLFHSLYAPDAGIYFQQLNHTLVGKLDIPHFKRAWQQVLARHPILRTSFVWDDLKEPVQVVHREVSLPIETHDWRELSAGQQQSRLESFLREDREQGFQLPRAPLMRLALIKVADDTYQFIWSFHHLLLDGWSVPLILGEVFTFYRAYCRGEQIELEQPRPYGDYISWLRQQDRSKAEVFWRTTLSGFAAPTSLLTGGASQGQGEQKAHFDEQRSEISRATTVALQSLAQEHQLTLNTLVQGAWGILLSRYSGEQDVVFGGVVSGRPAKLVGVEKMVGLFINTLPVRLKVEPDARVLSWLKQLQRQQVEAREYEYSSLIEVQGYIEAERGKPLFESILAFENYPKDISLHDEGKALEVRNVSAYSRTNYPLTVVVGPSSELRLKILYDTNRFEAAAITRMLGHIQVLMESIAAGAEQKISELRLLTQDEQRQLLVQWNDTETEYAGDVCIHQLFEKQVESTPDAVAAVFKDKKIIYRELNSRANNLAHHLRALGIGPDVRVAICLERSLDMLIGTLGILKAGGAYVPLDPTYPKDRLSFMLEDAEATVLLTHQRLLPTMPGYGGRLICLDADWKDIAVESRENPNCNVKAENLAYVIYTSGSTGTPKGVMVEHKSAVSYLCWVNESLVSDRFKLLPAVTGLTFDASLKQLFAPLLRGGVVWIPSNETVAQTSALLDAVSAQSNVGLNCVPSLWKSILDAVNSGEAVMPTGSLTSLFVGGEQLSKSLVDLSFAALPHLQIWNLYGPTEVTANAAVARITPDGDITIGRPIANTLIYLLDSQMQPVPVGVTGQLHIGGERLARGYLNRAELTAENFIPDPFSRRPGARMYRTGDLGRYLPDGQIEYLGRLDHQVKMRGYRVELGEIEAVLRQNAAVSDAVVVAQRDAAGGNRFVAYVVQNQGRAFSARELRNFLKEKLPEYMLPAVFMPLDALPLMPNGKLDRHALPEPEGARPELEAAYVPPRNEVERSIAAIWQEALQVEKVGIHDNFFDLGGHSLLMVRVQGRLRQALSRDISIVEMFESPTIDLLVNYYSGDQNRQPSFQKAQDRASKRRAAAERQTPAGKQRRKTNE